MNGQKEETLFQAPTSYQYLWPGFAVGYSSITRIVKEEILLYPGTSFLAEFGGAMGLFLGFSFLGMWEFCQSKIDSLLKMFK